MPSAARLFALLELLESSPVVSGAQIADRLGVDRRTVRRDVQALQELGIPVVGARGAGGGYRLQPGFRLPPLMLSADEATAAVLGLSASRRLALGDPEAAGSALAKLRRVLPDALRLQTEALEAVTAFRARSPGAAPTATGTVLLLAEAIFRRRRVRLRYESFEGRRSERELSPLGLVVGERFWYLAAHDHGRDALRTFRVDRIGGLELLTEGGVAPPEGFDAAEHVERSLHEVPWRFRVEVRLALPVEEARRRLAGTLARTADDGAGGTVLTLGAESLDWVASLLAGLGCPFEVVQPGPELREALDRLARRLLAA